MARYKKDSKGLYRKTFTIEGKKYSVRSKKLEDLFEKEKQKREEILQKLNEEDQDIHNPSLNDYYKTFTDIRRSEVREATIRAQKYQFRNIADVEIKKGCTFGKLRMKDITRRDIEVCRQILLNQGKTPENLNICFAHLNHVFQNAVLDETIEKNPCKSLKRLKRNTEPITKNKHRALSIEETRLFFGAAEERNSFYYNVFELMIRTGMRIGEISALYITDIDKDNGVIHVRRTISRDEIGAYYVSDDPKTVSGLRDIPLTTDIIAIIKRQEELNRMIFGLQWNGLLFKSSEGEILREYTLNREIKRICKDADINYFTSHAFRDTFATRFIEQRPQDYKILSEILGHKDISITLNLYTQVMKENKINAMNDINIKIG